MPMRKPPPEVGFGDWPLQLVKMGPRAGTARVSKFYLRAMPARMAKEILRPVALVTSITEAADLWSSRSAYR